ncbi:HD domain-containing protein [Marinifilum caeruleilacunae]|uniref:HD domain-containing protein n=1 Tax=Marinifilum caeruleilacunae TaxID=2499076 RepID=A0ABX1WZY3_9BACT|nr:HD domain-containing protein [Marinifilum caeruleilacunae]NOU61728.1 HD domain-containing protein [Marinifilum caeruleilacunae]
MNQEIYENIRSWFDTYSNSLTSENDEIQFNIELKRNHSFNTVELLSDLMQEASVSETETLIARISALVHDVGRFEQLMNYETFSDTDHVNHIDLGISLLQSENVLSELDDDKKEIVFECIRYHGVDVLPKSINENALTIAKLLRDADRIDALNIVSKYYSEYKSGTNKRLEMELADQPEISKKVYKAIVDEKVVSNKDVLTLNELKLHQMSWIYDLNFKKSFKIVSEKNYLKKMYETLPKKDEVIDMYRQMKIFLENQL